MNAPRRAVLPKGAPFTRPREPDPRQRPDERQDGGPDFGQEARQDDAPARLPRDARHGPPRADRD